MIAWGIGVWVGGNVAVARGGLVGSGVVWGWGVDVSATVDVGRGVGGTAVKVAEGRTKSGVGVGVTSSWQPARTNAAKNIKAISVNILVLLILNNPQAGNSNKACIVRGAHLRFLESFQLRQIRDPG